MIAYLVTNKITGKQYIGITTRSLARRWYEHGLQGNALSSAIKKYGVESFNIAHIASALGSINNLKALEVDLINQYNTYKNGYNLTTGGDGTFGYKHTQEQRNKNSEAQKGKQVSQQTKQKLSNIHLGEKHHYFGKGHLIKGKQNPHFKGTIFAISKKLHTVIELNGAADIKDAGFNTSNVYQCLSGVKKTHKDFIFKRIA